ncbi:hypothetical protein BH11BAC3_BH11BAC3_06400 [soil metagenome]
MKKLITALLFLPLYALAQLDSIASDVYAWKAPLSKTTVGNILFEGSTNDFEWMQMSSNFITVGKKTLNGQVAANEEWMYFIKSGTIKISFNDAVQTIGANSMAMLLPGQKFTLNNEADLPAVYYLVKYRSKAPVDITRGNNSGGSFVKEFSQVEFKAHDRGGTRSYFTTPTAMGKRLEMHVSTLNAGIQSHAPHTHRAAEMIIMIEGNTEMQVGDEIKKGNTGDVYFLGSNVLHGIKNIGDKPCMYYAFQFE